MKKFFTRMKDSRKRVAAALCLILWPLSRHRAVHWATKLSANLGKLTVFWGQHYREYA